MQRKNLAVDEFFDPKKVRVRMGNTFLQAWNFIAQQEHELTLPILVAYSTIDKVTLPPKLPLLLAAHILAGHSNL